MLLEYQHICPFQRLALYPVGHSNPEAVVLEGARSTFVVGDSPAEDNLAGEDSIRLGTVVVGNSHWQRLVRAAEDTAQHPDGLAVDRQEGVGFPWKIEC